MPFSIFCCNGIARHDVISGNGYVSIIINRINLEEGRAILELLSQSAEVYTTGFPTLEPIPYYQLNLQSNNPKIFVATSHYNDIIVMFVCFPEILATTAVYFKLKYGGN